MNRRNWTGLDISQALPTRFDRFNDWLDDRGGLYIGFALCVLLAIALPHWLDAKYSAAQSHGTPGGVPVEAAQLEAQSAPGPLSVEKLDGFEIAEGGLSFSRDVDRE